MEFHLRTKPIAIRGSVALKLHAIIPVRNGSENRIRLVDQCMPLTVAQELVNILTVGVRGRPGDKITIDGDVQPKISQTFGPAAFIGKENGGEQNGS